MSVLTDDLRKQIEDYLPRYPSKQAVTLPALHLVQDTLRCVPLEAIKEIAEILELHPSQVYDTMTFYGFFRTEKDPLGKIRLLRPVPDWIVVHEVAHYVAWYKWCGGERLCDPGHNASWASLYVEGVAAVIGTGYAKRLAKALGLS